MGNIAEIDEPLDGMDGTDDIDKHMKGGEQAEEYVVPVSEEENGASEDDTMSRPGRRASWSQESKEGKPPASWEPRDDLLLRHLKEVRQLGWKEISRHFHDRTPNACQFRWRRLRSGNLRTRGEESVVDEEIQAVPTSQKIRSAVEPRQAAEPRVFADTHELCRKFTKPRSLSHSTGISPRRRNTVESSDTIKSQSDQDFENFGFVPKIIIRSRRSSFVHPTHGTPSNLPPTIWFNGHKSRKNSFTTTRRSSLNVGTNLNISRRSSVILASSVPVNKSRRRSSVKLLSSNYMDTQKEKPWSVEEDQLLVEHKLRNLSMVELSILLPFRTETDIQSRLGHLNSQKDVQENRSRLATKPLETGHHDINEFAGDRLPTRRNSHDERVSTSTTPENYHSTDSQIDTNSSPCSPRPSHTSAANGKSESTDSPTLTFPLSNASGMSFPSRDSSSSSLSTLPAVSKLPNVFEGVS